MAIAPPRRVKYAILDDDPTGVQTLGGVRVLLEWTSASVTDALEHARSVHMLTNARAYPAAEARTLVASAAAAALKAAPRPVPILRGDSTLRGHLLEEYLALLDARGDGRAIPLVLAPALPSAGRVTVNGVQYLERNGKRVPVHTTEYAADGPFAYSSSRLLDWAEERTARLFPATDGIELHLPELRSEGPAAVVSAIRSARAAQRPTAVVIDSETADDVELVALGLERAIASGEEAAVRCGPALAGALGGATAREKVAFPSASAVMVVCGSYVPQSARQLEAVASRFPRAMVEVDPLGLVTADESLISTTAARVDRLLTADGVAVVALEGPPPRGVTDLAAGLAIARGLAAVVARVGNGDRLVVLKGGVTSAVVLAEGLGVRKADIVGPVLPGVALWRVVEPERRSCLVVPGNVGGDDLLVTILDRARQQPS